MKGRRAKTGERLMERSAVRAEKSGRGRMEGEG